MSNQNQNPKFKIKEFQWFQMQTRVRQIIQEVLGPMQKRILQNSSVLNKVKFTQTQDSKKIEQIALMIANDPKVFETGIFLSVQKKFEGQQKKIQELSRQIEQQNKYVDQKFKILDVRMQESSQVLQNVAAMRQRVAKQMQLQNQNINSIRKNLQKMIDDLNQDLRQARNQTQKNLQSCQKADYDIQEKISEISLNISRIKQTLLSHQELHRQESCNIEYNKQKLKKHAQQIVQLQQSKTLTKKLCDYTKDMKNEIDKFDFKLTTIIPLITQAQIGDCLYAVLPQKMKKRIAIHQYKKYFKLNRQVLQKKFEVTSARFHGIELLEQMQKKNTKEIVQMKRKKLLAMGVDIDHLTYEQRQRYYNELVLEDTIDDDDQEVRVTAKVDEKQVLQIVKNHFSSFISSVSQKINIELEDSKKYLYGIQDQIRREIQATEQRFEKLKKFSQTYQTQQILENKSLMNEIQKVDRSIEGIWKQFAYLNGIQKSMYNFCSLVNHLQIQDEIDKQNISLMGLQESNADQVNQTSNNAYGQSSSTPLAVGMQNSILQLEKKCFSCCGFPATSLSAFKMACLAYSPSPIIIDSNQYKREQLLEFTTNILQGIKKSLQTDNETNSTVQNQTENQKQDMQNQQGIIHQGQKQTQQQYYREIARVATTSHYNRNNAQVLQIGTSQNQKEKSRDRKLSTSNYKVRKTKKYSMNPSQRFHNIVHVGHISQNNTHNIQSGNASFLNNSSVNRSSSKHNEKGLREDMIHVSNAFLELKRRNISFLM